MFNYYLLGGFLLGKGIFVVDFKFDFVFIKEKLIYINYIKKKKVLYE